MRLKVFYLFFVLMLLLVSCQKQIPFLKDNKISIRAPASTRGDNSYAIKGAELSQKELDLALSVCQDLRSLRFNWPFYSSKEKQMKFDLQYDSCEGIHKEEFAVLMDPFSREFFSGGILHDEQGSLASFCPKILHGVEILENTELSASGELLHYKFELGTNNEKIAVVTRSVQDYSGEYYMREKEVMHFTQTSDVKKRGLAIKRVREKVCTNRQGHGVERFEQILSGAK